MIPGISWDSRDYKPLISHSLPVAFSNSRSLPVPVSGGWGDSLTLPNMYLLHICTKKKQPFGKGTPNRGCSYITSAAGGEGVRQILTIADEGGMGGKFEKSCFLFPSFAYIAKVNKMKKAKLCVRP